MEHVSHNISFFVLFCRQDYVVVAILFFTHNAIFQDDDGSPKHQKSVRSSSKTKSFHKDHKDISPGIIKDRPSTIVGTPLRAQRVSTVGDRADGCH